jgi:hypothetical protein
MTHPHPGNTRTMCGQAKPPRAHSPRRQKNKKLDARPWAREYPIAGHK